MTDQDAICIGEKVYRSGVAGITYINIETNFLFCPSSTWTAIPIAGMSDTATQDFGKIFWTCTADKTGICIEEDGLYYIGGSACIYTENVTGTVTRTAGIFVNDETLITNEDNYYSPNYNSHEGNVCTGGRLCQCCAGSRIQFKALITGTSGYVNLSSTSTYLSIMKIQ